LLKEEQSYMTPIQPAISTIMCPRLLLRPLHRQDLKTIHKLRTCEENQQYIDREVPKNMAESEAFLERIVSGVEERVWYNWSICLKRKPRMIGSIGMWKFSDDHTSAELGYELLPGFKQKGYMSEALEDVLTFAKTALNLEILYAVTHQDNLASRTLLQKFQFTLDEGFKDPEDLSMLRYKRAL
jgi:ribosomal-protein-alanine N-acetyltransferase